MVLLHDKFTSCFSFFESHSPLCWALCLNQRYFDGKTIYSWRHNNFWDMNFKMAGNVKSTLHEKCPITDFFLLVHIFPHLVCVRRDTEYLSVFSPNVGKYRPEKTPYLGTFHAVALKTNMFHSIINNNRIFCSIELSLREKCPNTELFLVRIFLYMDWIRRFMVNLRIQSKYRKIWTRNNSVFGHFSRSVCIDFSLTLAFFFVFPP